jgi:hypothetical protein
MNVKLFGMEVCGILKVLVLTEPDFLVLALFGNKAPLIDSIGLDSLF